jgi:apolipoprotein N-acyltransferase
MGLRCMLKLLLLGVLCWVMVVALWSVVERLRLLCTLALPLLLRGMARYSPHNFMYECAQIASIYVSSQLMDQLMGLGLGPGLYLSDEASRFVALGLECLITATQS